MKITSKMTVLLFSATFPLFAFISDAGAQVCVAPPSGLVSWWPFDETSGTTTADIVGSNPGVVKAGAAYVTGKVGNALDFNGGGGTVEIAHNANLKPSSQITIDAWIKPNAVNGLLEIFRKEDGNDRSLLSFQPGGFCTDGMEGDSSAPCLAFGISTGGTYKEFEVGGAIISNLVDGNFHHVAATYDGASRKIYIDGNLEGSIADSGTIGTSGTAPAFIGSGAGSGEFFNGVIDEVEFFDRALSASEIQAIFDAGSAGKCKATVIKKLVSGPRVDNGGTLIDLAGLVTGANDAGPIDVGRTDAQFYEFVIEIIGRDSTLAGAVATDVIPAEYDLDPLCGEDTWTICDTAQTGDIDRNTDYFADGIVNDTVAACTVATSTSGGGDKKGGVGLEPEFVDISLAGNFGDGDICTVHVFVHTDENPGKRTTRFEPTGCRELDSGTFDTIALNNGVKLFDTGTGERLFGPVGSLQLTPNNCP